MQPDDGVEPVRQFVASAEKSLLLKQFTFTEESLLETVIERHNAGVDVRVMLNPARSGGDRANDDSFTRLQGAGVNVAWTNPKFYVTHEKSIVVDGQAALVATFNLCEKYFTLTRDYGVVTTVPQHVAQIVDAFDADWEHRDDWHPAVFEGGCCGAIRIRDITWRNSSTPPRTGSIFSIRNTWTR